MLKNSMPIPKKIAGSIARSRYPPARNAMALTNPSNSLARAKGAETSLDHPGGQGQSYRHRSSYRQANVCPGDGGARRLVRPASVVLAHGPAGQGGQSFGLKAEVEDDGLQARRDADYEQPHAQELPAAKYGG